MYVYTSIYVYTVRYRQRIFFSFRTKESIYMSNGFCVVRHSHGVTIPRPSYFFAVDNAALRLRSCFMYINNLMFSYIMCLRCSIFSYLGRNAADKRLCGPPVDSAYDVSQTVSRGRPFLSLGNRANLFRLPHPCLLFIC